MKENGIFENWKCATSESSKSYVCSVCQASYTAAKPQEYVHFFVEISGKMPVYIADWSEIFVFVLISYGRLIVTSHLHRMDEFIEFIPFWRVMIKHS